MQSRLHELVNRQDESLKHPEHQDFVLSILFDKDGFSFCVFDEHNKKFKALNRNSLQKSSENPEHHLCYEFKQYWRNQGFARLFFKKVALLDAIPANAFVPKAFFDKNKARQLLQSNSSEANQADAAYDSILSGEVMNVYYQSGPITRLGDELFENRFHYRHHTSCFTDTIHQYLPPKSAQKNIFLNVRDRNFDMLVFKDKKLLFSNTFSFQTREDFIYFILFVFEQHQLNPEKDKVFLSGDIMRNSSLHQILTKYIRYSDFLKRNELFKYAYFFDEIPDHLYFSLLNSVKCV